MSRKDLGVLISGVGAGIVIGTTASLSPGAEGPVALYITTAIFGVGAGQYIRARVESDQESLGEKIRRKLVKGDE